MRANRLLIKQCNDVEALGIISSTLEIYAKLAEAKYYLLRDGKLGTVEGYGPGQSEQIDFNEYVAFHIERFEDLLR